MSGVSIYDAVRVSKVNVGNAPMYAGMRSFDPSAQVCPARSNVSDSGVVGVARDSIQTYTAGCFSPLDRITVENNLRPRYSVYLRASAINDPGVGDPNLTAANPDAQGGPYDSRFGNGQQFGQQLPWNEMIPQVKYTSMHASSPDVASNPQLQEANQVDCFMNTLNRRQGCNLYQ